MKDKLTIKDKNGIECNYDILFELEVEDKKIIAYTKYEKDNDKIICYSSYIDKKNILTDITKEEDLKLIDITLKTLEKSSKINYKKA
jgi:uncharacterized protein YrzB (UPF0473 family)